MAYSLFLFIRDAMDSDLVGWIDRQLAAADTGRPDRIERMGAAVIEPLCNVFGASDKVVRMTLAELLLGAGRGRPAWIEVGGSLIAIDTLVHNFLHRTGVQAALGKPHPYGPACYGKHGCEAAIKAVAAEIDAAKLNSAYPGTFPRFVQNSIWRYCAQRHFDVCNGNNIAANQRCTQYDCGLFKQCAKYILIK